MLAPALPPSTIAGDTIDYTIAHQRAATAPPRPVLTDGSDVTIVLHVVQRRVGDRWTTSSADAAEVIREPERLLGRGHQWLGHSQRESWPGCRRPRASCSTSPVVATVRGQAGTNFKTDVRMVNRSGGSGHGDHRLLRQEQHRPDGSRTRPPRSRSPPTGRRWWTTSLNTVWGISSGKGALVRDQPIAR